MKIDPFAIEHYFALYEFNTPYLLCSSDCAAGWGVGGVVGDEDDTSPALAATLPPERCENLGCDTSSAIPHSVAVF